MPTTQARPRISAADHEEHDRLVHVQPEVEHDRDEADCGAPSTNTRARGERGPRIGRPEPPEGPGDDAAVTREILAQRVAGPSVRRASCERNAERGPQCTPESLGRSKCRRGHPCRPRRPRVQVRQQDPDDHARLGEHAPVRPRPYAGLPCSGSRSDRSSGSSSSSASWCQRSGRSCFCSCLRRVCARGGHPPRHADRGVHRARCPGRPHPCSFTGLRP